MELTSLPNLTLPSEKNEVFVSTYTIVDVIRPEEKAQYSDIDIIFVLTRTSSKEGEEQREHRFRLIAKLYQNGNLPVNVSYLLVHCGFMHLPHENKEKIIKQLLWQDRDVDALRELFVGKEIQLLKYVYDKDEQTGNLKYKFWDGKTDLKERINPFDPKTDWKKVINAFYRKVNSQFTVKDFKPYLVNGNETENSNSEEMPF